MKISRWFLAFFLLGNILFLLANLPMIIFIQRTPVGAHFPLYHNNSWYDYNMYLSAITQGAHGNWLLRDPYTTEPTNPTVFYNFYVMLGKITGPFGIPSFIAYHASRIIFVEAFLVALFGFARIFFTEKKAFLATLFVLLATTAPVRLFGEPGAFKEFTPWWAEMDALKRIDIMPHYLFGYTSLLLILGFFFREIKAIPGIRISLIPGIALAFIAFVGTLFFPPSGLPILIILPLFFLQHLFVFTKGGFADRKKLSFSFAIFLSSCLALLLIWRENANGFPWNTWNVWEKTTYNVPQFDRELLLVFGILPLLALPSVIWAITKRNASLLALALWAALPFILLPFIDILGFSKYRIVTTGPFIPMGLLAAHTVLKLIKKKRIQAIAILLFLFSTIPVSASRLISNVKTAEQFPLYPIMFIPDTTWRALDFIKTGIPIGAAILSDEYIGNVLPAHAPVTSFIGHFVHTKDFYKKKEILRIFFGGTIAESDALQFIKNNGISYVFWGPDEKRYGTTTLPYSFLEPVYKNADVIIYKVK